MPAIKDARFLDPAAYEARIRSSRISARLTAREHAAFSARALRAAMSEGAYLRLLVMRDTEAQGGPQAGESPRGPNGAREAAPAGPAPSAPRGGGKIKNRREL